MSRWEKKANEALAGFHGVGNAVREAVAAALEAAHEEGRKVPREEDVAEPGPDAVPGPG